MHARVVSIQVQSGKTDEAIAIYRDVVVPAAKQQKGFKSALLLTDPATGKGVSVTVWETEADLKASEASGYLQQQLTRLGATLAGPPIREAFVVSCQS